MAARNIKGITIEIGGDTTKLSQALGKVDNDLRKTQSNLRDVNKLLKLDPGNVTLLTQKEEELNKKVADTKTRLETAKEALEQLKNTNGVDNVTDKQKALEREIIATEQELKNAEKELKNFGSVGKQQAEAVAQKMQETGEKIKAVGEGVKNAGSTLSKNVSAPIVGGFTAAVKVTSDFESQMSKVQAITGSNGEDMTKLEKKAREMGAQTKFSATEAGEAMEYMGMAGWKTDEIMDGLAGIMNLAAASGEDLGTTSDIVTDALTAFGLSASDSGHFADVLAAASTNANTNVSMLGESFKYVAPVAGAMGYSVEDISVALGLMANSGIKASSAGTSLRTLLTNMAKPTETVAIAMEDLGVSLDDGQGNMKTFDQVMQDLRKGFGNTKIPMEDLEKQLATLEGQFESGELTEKKYDKAVEELMEKAYGAEGALKAKTAAALAGKTGMSGLLAIVNASDADYEKLTNAIRGSSEEMDGYNGQAEKMAGVMQDNLQGQLTILMSQLQELAISIGESLLPTVKDIVSKIQEGVDWLNNLDQAQKDTIIRVAAVVAAVGPLLVIVGTVISSIGSIVSGVGSVIGAGGKLMPVITGIGAKITAAGGLIPALGSLLTAAAPFLIGGAIIIGIVTVTALIIKNWDTIKQKATELMQWVTQKWTELKDKVTTTVENLKTTVTTKFENLKTTVKTKVETMKTDVQNKIEAMKENTLGKIEALKDGAAKKWDSVKEKALGIFGDIKEGITDKIDSAKEKVSDIVDDIKDLFDFDWSLPDLKLPHINVGSYIDVPVLGRIPDPATLSVDWYRRAYDQPVMFTRPTVLQTPYGAKGFGDKHGSGEIVLSDDKLRQIAGSGASYTVNVYASPGMNVNELADAVQNRLVALQRQKEAAGIA